MEDPSLHTPVLKAISSRRLPTLILLETLVLFAEPEESLLFRPAAPALFAYAFRYSETNRGRFIHEWWILIKLAVELSSRRVDRNISQILRDNPWIHVIGHANVRLNGSRRVGEQERKRETRRDCRFARYFARAASQTCSIRFCWKLANPIRRVI